MIHVLGAKIAKKSVKLIIFDDSKGIVKELNKTIQK